MQHLDTRAIEPLPFLDCMCQMLDLVKSRIPGECGWVLCFLGMTLSFMVFSHVCVIPDDCHMSGWVSFLKAVTLITCGYLSRVCVVLGDQNMNGWLGYMPKSSIAGS